MEKNSPRPSPLISITLKYPHPFPSFCAPPLHIQKYRKSSSSSFPPALFADLSLIPVVPAPILIPVVLIPSSFLVTGDFRPFMSGRKTVMVPHLHRGILEGAKSGRKNLLLHNKNGRERLKSVKWIDIAHGERKLNDRNVILIRSL